MSKKIEGLTNMPNAEILTDWVVWHKFVKAVEFVETPATLGVDFNWFIKFVISKINKDD